MYNPKQFNKIQTFHPDYGFPDNRENIEFIGKFPKKNLIFLFGKFNINLVFYVGRDSVTVSVTAFISVFIFYRSHFLRFSHRLLPRLRPHLYLRHHYHLLRLFFVSYQ